MLSEGCIMIRVMGAEWGKGGVIGGGVIIREGVLIRKRGAY